jgi:hypothetical protein
MIWLLLSAFIIGVSVWSTQILFQQKRTWSAYAKKHSYDYKPGKMMESPSIAATVDNMRLSLYTDVQRTNDARGERYVTVIEIIMGPGMPTGGALATPELRPFVDSLSFGEIYSPDNFPGWKSAYIVKTRDSKKLKAYLTAARLEVLNALFSMKNSMSLFFFDEEECVLRIETSDPLRRPEHLEKIVRRITESAKKLKIADAEKEAPASPAPSAPSA